MLPVDAGGSPNRLNEPAHAPSEPAPSRSSAGPEDVSSFALTPRQRLKLETRADHELTERAYDKLDLGTIAGLCGMLLAHAAALRLLIPSLAKHQDLHAEVSRLDACIERDLRFLGQSQPLDVRLEGMACHPLGVAYVILGSRLGAAVQTSQLALSAEAVGKPPYSYLTDRNSGEVWKALLARLNAAVGHVEVAQIIDAARETFSVFRSAAATAVLWPAQTIHSDIPE